MANVFAPAGYIYVCSACGKRSRDRYGHQAIDRGWDASCAVHALLVDESKVVLGDDGRVVQVKRGGVINPETWQPTDREIRP